MAQWHPQNDTAGGFTPCSSALPSSVASSPILHHPQHSVWGMCWSASSSSWWFTFVSPVSPQCILPLSLSGPACETRDFPDMGRLLYTEASFDSPLLCCLPKYRGTQQISTDIFRMAFLFELGSWRNSWHSFMWTYSMVLMLPTQCLSALCYRTTMCTTQDKFSLGFYRKQMVGYYVDDTVSHWWLFQAAHSASLLFSSSTETQNIKHNGPFLACERKLAHWRA